MGRLDFLSNSYPRCVNTSSGLALTPWHLGFQGLSMVNPVLLLN
jgi:hypothetical protein